MAFPSILRAWMVATLLVMGAWAQDPDGLAPATALAHRVERLKAAFPRGDAAVAAASQEVELLRRDFGTLDMVPLVEAMAIWARGLGDVDQGLRVVQHLERWAPKHPILLSTKVILLRQKGARGYVESLPEVLELTRRRLAHPVHRWLFVVQHLAWVRLMATLLLWGWTLALLLRYRNVFRYLWEEPLGRRVPSGALRALLGAVLLTLPVLAGLDPSVCALAWLWLAVPFMLGQELKYSILIILFQLVHPLLAVLEPMAIQDPTPSLVSMQLQPSWQPIDWGTVPGLPKEDQRYLTGWQLLQTQHWAQAEAQFQGLRAQHPFRSGVVNNLGVAVFQQGRVEEASRLFDEAALAAPDQPEVLVNQSTLAFRKLDSVTGGQKQDEARRVAPALYNQLSAASQSRNEQRVYAVPLPDSPGRTAALQARFGTFSGSPSGRQREALAFWTVLPLLAAGLFVWRARQSIRQAHPTQCIRCGDPHHTTDSPDVDVCSKCHHLFVLKDGLHSGSRKAKVDEVARFQTQQRWLHRILLVVLPGADLVFLGQPGQGMTEYAILSLAAGVVVGTGRTVRYPGEILPDPATIWLPVGLGLLVILFLRSWFKLIPRRT
jgi:hypothetical protein